MSYNSQDLGYDRFGKKVVSDIELREGKKYKLIVMAIEEADNDKGK